VFGTLEDFDRLVADAHARGMRVIVDWVPNHTSDRHPWFVESRSSRDSGRRDWYVWRDSDPGREGPPNNWLAAFGEEKKPAWTFDAKSGQWYLHLFLPEQPDLNWANPSVREAMTDVLRFWLDRGVDGFRIDVVHALGKDQALPDAPEALATIPWCAQNDHESTHEILRDLRRVIDGYPQRPTTVGEVFLLDTEAVSRYYGEGDELHLSFNFPPMFCKFEARCFRRRIEDAAKFLDPRGAWPTWVLSNHDRPRHRTRYGGTETAARAAAVMLLTLRGTPFLYAGEELGLEDTVVPAEAVVDPGGRDGCRAPIPWTAESGHGWALDGSEPWLPWPPGAGAGTDAESMRADPGSILHLYRRLLSLRRSETALSSGYLRLVDAPQDVLAYERGDDRARFLVLINFGSDRVVLEEGIGTGGSVALSSLPTDPAGEDGEPAPFRGVLDAGEALVVRLANTRADAQAPSA
ncbi:MAG TPA: alpha-amylase family glycosyl hydrolase, partial [Acidimicrobiales bacterium]|nr:alpha-amylase family glycosyl hydrolase [Acidimicrobiales bacterium]